MHMRHIRVEIPHETHVAIKNAAAEEGITLGGWIDGALRQAARARQQAARPIDPARLRRIVEQLDAILAEVE
jgi:hypothetical protein